MKATTFGFFLFLSLSAVACNQAAEDEHDTASSEVSLAPPCTAVPTPMCDSGTELADYDGDGCFEACKPVACPAVLVECPDGEELADVDGDGCEDACKPVACPPVWVTCPAGEKVVDRDGDGCALECEPE